MIVYSSLIISIANLVSKNDNNNNNNNNKNRRHYSRSGRYIFTELRSSADFGAKNTPVTINKHRFKTKESHFCLKLASLGLSTKCNSILIFYASKNDQKLFFIYLLIILNDYFQ